MSKRLEKLGQLRSLLDERGNLERNIDAAIKAGDMLPTWQTRLREVNKALDKLVPEEREVADADTIR